MFALIYILFRLVRFAVWATVIAVAGVIWLLIALACICTRTRAPRFPLRF